MAYVTMFMRLPSLSVCITVAWLLATYCVTAAPEATVVLANRNVPASVELARIYATARSIPTDQVCLLDLPDEYELSREEYVRLLRDPLLAWLRERELIQQQSKSERDTLPNMPAWKTVKSDIRFLVSMYGVPVRIEDSRGSIAKKVMDTLRKGVKSDAAAVDAELALLLFDAYDIAGPYRSPMHAKLRVDELPSSTPPFLMATRLDGPSPEAVKEQIKACLDAEHYGLHGRVYIDGRGITGSYYRGDYWMKEAFERFRREGYECLMDNTAALWGDAVPMEDAAVYMGWYVESVAGPFRREGFKFRPGAVAYHLHSSSGKDIRSPDTYWVGPLLSSGAAAVMGAVTEPFLSFTPELHIFASRLCDGMTLAESSYMAQSAVSWMITTIGDPLYRPFKNSLEAQIENLERDGRPEVEWAYLRRVNLMVRDGRFNTALAYCRDKIRSTGSLVLREKLGDLYAKNELFNEAGEQYEAVLAGAKTPETSARVASRWIILQLHLGHRDQAADIVERVKRKWGEHACVVWLEGVHARSVK